MSFITFLFFFFARRISNVARFSGKGLGRVVAGGLVGRARKNALIEGISDAVVVVVDDVFFTTTTTTTTTISLTPHF